MNAQLHSDILAYRSTDRAYSELCASCENDRAAAVNGRELRRTLHAAKVEAAENVLMSVQGYFGETMKKMGIYDLYVECTNGTGSLTTLFTLADATSRLID